MDFVEYLKNKGHITENEAKEIYEYGENIFLTLRNKKIIDDVVLVQEATKHYGVEILKNTIELSVDVEKTKQVGDVKILLKGGNVALKDDNSIYFLIDNPDDVSFTEKVKDILADAKIVIANVADRADVIKRLVQPIEIQHKAEKISKESELSKSLLSTAISSEAQELLDDLIEAALENRASDMHIVPLKDEIRISFRIDGKIESYMRIPKNILDNIKNILCNRAEIPERNPNLPIEGKFIFSAKKEKVDVRINAIPSKLGWDINMRFLSSKMRTIQDIGFLEDDIKKYKDLLNMTKGLIVITGPTGCGKTTSLYAGLDSVKNSGKKVMTLEDPVESTLPGITQIDIKASLGFGYEQGVATTLRHDPDITLIGETRVLTVAEEVIKLADTGHLTITTMHTRDSVSAISRFLNLGISPYSLGDTLSAVIAQRLVRRICPKCKEEYALPKEHEWRDMFALGDDEITLARGRGCPHCAGKGFRGRIVIVEFLLSNSEISIAIQNKENRYSILEKAKKSGFASMIEDGVKKALLHYTTFDELEQIKKDI